MESENKKANKYYKGMFYFDHTSKRMFVYSLNTNRITLNFANKWSYLIMTLILVLFILGLLFNKKTA